MEIKCMKIKQLVLALSILLLKINTASACNQPQLIEFKSGDLFSKIVKDLNKNKQPKIIIRIWNGSKYPYEDILLSDLTGDQRQKLIDENYSLAKQLTSLRNAFFNSKELGGLEERLGEKVEWKVILNYKAIKNDWKKAKPTSFEVRGKAYSAPRVISKKLNFTRGTDEGFFVNNLTGRSANVFYRASTGESLIEISPKEIDRFIEYITIDDVDNFDLYYRP